MSPIRESEDEEDDGEETEEEQATETSKGDIEGFLTNMPPPKTFDYEGTTLPATQVTEHQADIVQPLDQPSNVALDSSHQEHQEHQIQSRGVEGETILPPPST